MLEAILQVLNLSMHSDYPAKGLKKLRRCNAAEGLLRNPRRINISIVIQRIAHCDGPSQ